MISALIGAWLIGAFGGLHCMTMCGGFTTAIAARENRTSGGGPGTTTALLPARTILRQQSAYHAGRLITYALLGAAFGAIGASSVRAIDLVPLQKALYIAANLFLITLALTLATRQTGVPWLQRAGARAFGRALPLLQPLLRRPGTIGRVSLGLVWGLVPCAMIYSVLPLALFAGGPWQGAAILLAFGIGTLPNLLAAGVLLDRMKPLIGRTTLQRAAAAMLVTFALAGIYRVLYAADGLAHGAFCLVP